MQDFVHRFGVDAFPNVNDADGSVFAHFGVPYQPAWVFIDSHGKAARLLGTIPESDLGSILDELAHDRLPA